MRNECQNCFDKWLEFAGFDSLVIHFPKFLSNDNVEIRIEFFYYFKIFKFLKIRNNEFLYET